jgi:hypothetical protein
MPQKQDRSNDMHIEEATPVQGPLDNDIEEAKSGSIYEV